MAQIMETITTWLIFILFVALIIGLIKPRLFLRNKRNARWKIAGLWFLATFVTALASSQITIHRLSKMTTAELINAYEKEKNSLAYDLLKKIPPEDSLYNKAQLLIEKKESKADPETKTESVSDGYTSISPVFISNGNTSYTISEYKISKNDSGNTVISVGGSGFGKMEIRNGKTQITAWCNFISAGKEYIPISGSQNAQGITYFYETSATPDSLLFYPANNEKDRTIINVSQ
jgi:hypothetical protein